MFRLNRRTCLVNGAGLLGSSILPRSLLATNSQAAKPHYFLHIVLDGGLDSSYLFDARPLDFTSANKIQNYTNEAPKTLVGSNGTKTLASSASAPLLALKNEFSIINGVHMAQGFDGHEQNMNMLFTGNPFGGASFIPELNSANNKLYLDYIQINNLFSLVLNNTSASVAFSPSSMYTLVQNIKNNFKARQANQLDPSSAFIQSRLEHLARGSGQFSLGTQKLAKSLADSGGLAGKLSSIELNEFDAQADNFEQTLKGIEQYFKSDVCKSAIIALGEFNLDTHDAEGAKAQPENYLAISEKLAFVFKFLKDSAYDESLGLSMYDVTTVLISSEFSRTTRQLGKSMDATGTDHNPFSNMILLGGKGIKSGQVIGASDLDVLDKNGEYAKVSKIHQNLDPQVLSHIGKSYDFESGQPIDSTKDTFNPDEHITINSVINTIYRLFNVDTKHFRTNSRNAAAAAKTLDHLIKL
ncbi:MAG: DUF1501 domain-containing protein [Oligoflexales bacterium]|nr:DUF1501 domain-containing protein [Oligoflexales bacterium]